MYAPIRHHDDRPARPRRARCRTRAGRRRRAAADAGRRPAAGRPARAGAAAPAATRPTRRAVCSSRPTREFLIGGRFTQHRRRPGALPALPGPARRAAVLELPLRVRASPTARGTSTRAPSNVGYRDQEFFGSYDRIGKLSLSGSWQQIPQFYSVDTMTPYTGSGGTLVLDDATQRAIQNGVRRTQRLRPARAGSSTCANGATSAASTWSRRRRRTSTSPPTSRRRSTAASCPGAPASASATTSRCRCPTSRARTTSPSAPSGRTRGTCCVSPTAARGSTTSRRRSSGTARSASTTRPAHRDGTHVALAVELGADHQLRRVHQAGAQDAGHRLLLLWTVEQRRAAAALHDQLGAAADRAAPREHRRRSARLLDQPEPHLAPVDRLAVQRARAQLHLRQPHAGHVHHGHGQLRSRSRRDAHGRSRPLRAQPDELRRRRDVGRD